MTDKNGTAVPTPASLWRKPREEGYLITLPSGNVARLRPVALDVLITQVGALPDILTPIAAKTLWSEEDTEKIAEVPELAKGFAQLVNEIIPAAFLEPVVITEGEPRDHEILLSDIGFADKVTVFNLCTAGAQTLQKFREQQTRNVEALHNGEGHSVKTKRASGRKQPVGSVDAG